METVVNNKIKSERIGFIDVMRGFTMVLVVMQRVCIYWKKDLKNESFCSILFIGG